MNRRSVSRLLAALAIVSVTTCGGSPTDANPDASNPQFVGPTGLKTRLDAVAAALAANPPTTAKGNAARKAAITDLDAMLWQVSVAGAAGADISAYYRAQMDKFASEMQQPVTDGVRIWALYNAGFVVKSPTKTIAFDLIDDRPQASTETPKDFKKFKYTIPASVIDQIDVLFISHEHTDHTGFNAAVAGRVKAKGGQVLFPKAGCLLTDANPAVCGTAPFANATVLVDSTSKGDLGGISYTVRNSEHGTVPNMNYEVVLPNGYKIVFQDSGSSKIRAVKNIDVLLESVWTNDTGSCKTSMVQEMTLDKPGLTIPHHMHEMSHDTIANGAGKTDGAGRCGGNRYRYSYPLELQDEVTPSKFALLTWGEKIDYKRP